MTSYADRRRAARWRSRLAALSVALAMAYILGVAVLYLQQRYLIYPGWGQPGQSAASDTDQYQRIETRTADGLKGWLLYHPAAPGRPVILFFHGNGGNVAGSIAAVRPLVKAGYGAVLPEYRGYGGLPGAPSELGLYADARAARAWMAANGIGRNGVIVMGYSLGTGVAAQMATEMRPRALVLIAPYSSIAHVAGARYPFVPVGLLLTERFDTGSKLPRIAAPILLLHGSTDRTIPAGESALLKRDQPRADRIVLSGLGHEVMYRPAAQAVIAGWLRRRGF